MNIFKQSEIDEASLNNSRLHYIMAFSEDLHKDADLDFKAGVRYAESKVEEIAVEFAEWILENRFEDFGRFRTSSEELFEIFLKERNND